MLPENPPPDPGTPTNPRDALVYTASSFGASYLGPSGTGGYPPIIATLLSESERTAPTAQQGEALVQGGAFASYATLAEGDGTVTYNLLVPDLARLLTHRPMRRQFIKSATVKVYLDVGSASRTLQDLVDIFVLDFANAAPAKIDRNVVLVLERGPRVLGRSWTILIDAHVWMRPRTELGEEFAEPVFLQVDCQLPVKAGSRTLLIQATAP
jgi:hypothetical protein